MQAENESRKPGSASNTLLSGDAGPQTELHLIRIYAANLKRVSDAYGRLEDMARESKTNEFVSLVALAGRFASAKLSEAGELLSVIEQAMDAE